MANTDDDYWAEVKGASIADWKYAVSNDETRQGYHEWAETMTSQDFCVWCNKLDHDQCSLTQGCPCCEQTMSADERY